MRNTHLVSPLSSWEDEAMLVTQAKGRPLSLAALSFSGPAKSPLLAAPYPQNCSRRHPSCRVELHSTPKRAMAGTHKPKSATRKLSNGPAYAQA